MHDWQEKIPQVDEAKRESEDGAEEGKYRGGRVVGQ